MKFSDSKLLFGQTEWGKQVHLTEQQLLKTHGLVCGATGSGKSYAILNIILQKMNKNIFDIGFGIGDQKGELFQKALEYIFAFLTQVDSKTRQKILFIDQIF